MLNFYDNHPRKFLACPIFVEFMGIFLNSLVVSFSHESLAKLRLKIWIQWSLPKSAKCIREMTMINDKRIARFRMFIKTFRQENTGAEVHRTAPEFCQEFTLNFYMLDIFRILWLRDWWDFFIKINFYHLIFLWINPQLLRSAVKITRCPVPTLSLSPIHREFHSMTISSMESLIAMEKSLNPVFSDRNL